MSMKKNRITCGIDIGAESTKVVLGPSWCEIVRNDVGGHTTPTCVSFANSNNNKQRFVGAAANPKTAITMLNRLLVGESKPSVGAKAADDDDDDDDDDVFVPFYPFTVQEDGSIVVVEYNNIAEGDTTPQSFTPSALLGMLLGHIRTNATATLQRIAPDAAKNADDNENAVVMEYAVALPPQTSEATQSQILDACYAANMTNAVLVDSLMCYQQALQRKFPELLTKAESENKTIMIVNMGHTQTTIGILQWTSSPEKDKEEDNNNNTNNNNKPRILSWVRNTTLGAGGVDILLYKHFTATVAPLHDVQPKSKGGQRLLKACQKLKHLLSQLPDATVTVENINDADIKISATRQQLAELCAVKDTPALQRLVKEALDQARSGGGGGGGEGNDDTNTSIVSIDTVEIVGGGCRMPHVQAAILEALKVDDHPVSSLSTSLDDTSAAVGAALFDDNDETKMVVQRNAETQLRKELKLAEEEMAALDQSMKLRAHAMNQLEAHILELRSAKHGKHGSKIPETLDVYLQEVEDWLFSEEADAASQQVMQEKLDRTLQETRELCADYFAAVQEETDAMERQLEAEAKKAQLERAGKEEDDDNDDHDTRRLPKKRRMEIVMKNKAEANELFSDGNYKFAAARYAKALSHCAKFIDLSPDDITEVKGVKLSLNLNLALAYLKLEKPDQALRVCNDALEIDGDSAKALYRRASVYYEKKDWSSAKRDVETALAVAPEDKAVTKLKDKIEAQIKRQNAKEKKMAQKMFG